MDFSFQQKKIFFLFVMVLLALSFVGLRSVRADYLPIEDSLGPEDEVFDDLYLQGSDVTVAGKVHGMLFVMGDKIVIETTAAIDNDIFIIGKNVVVEEGASVSGNLFIAGQNVVIKSSVFANLMVASITLDVTSSTSIGKNLFFIGVHAFFEEGSVVNDNLYAGCYQISVAGSIEDNLRISAVSVELSGIVLKNAEISIDASVEDEGVRILYPYLQLFNIPDLLPAGLNISDKASIQGKLIYTSAKSLEENLKSLPLGGVIENLPENEITKEDQQDKVVQKNPFVSRILRMLHHAVGFVIFTFITWKFGRKYLPEAVHFARSKPLQSLGSGFLSILVVYIGLMVAIVILVFISLLFRFLTLNQIGSFLTLLGFSMAVIVYVSMAILILYISKLVIAFWVGKLLIQKINPRIEKKDIWGMILGIFFNLFLYLIPVIGWLLGVIISLVGLGAIWYTMQNHDRAGILPDFD